MIGLTIGGIGVYKLFLKKKKPLSLDKDGFPVCVVRKTAKQNQTAIVSHTIMFEKQSKN